MTYSNQKYAIGTVDRDMFGGNAIHDANLDRENGTLYDHFVYAALELGVTHFRIPGGQAENFFDGGVLPGGDIPDRLRTALEMIRDQLPHVTVSIVVPTDRSYTKAADVEALARIVAEDFPGQVTAYEIGNEYWGEEYGGGAYGRETFYGARASEIAEALDRGLGKHGDDVDILVQTANPNGHGSAYNWKKKDGPGAGMGAEARWDAANTAIADELSAKAIEAIDGIIHHFYWTSLEADDLSESGEFRLPWHVDTWERELGKSLELHLTEWNVSKNNYELQGLRGGGAFLDMFADMIAAGVDAAQVWPLQHNTRNDLAGGNRQDAAVDPETGIVVSSVSGALFDLLAQNVQGLDLLARDVPGLAREAGPGTPFVAQYFQSEDVKVTYVSSHAMSGRRLDLSDKLAMNGEGMTVTVVGMDRTTSDGLRSNGAGAANAVTVHGEDYFYDEDDVAASIRTLEFTAKQIADGAFVFLRPFEIAQIVSGDAPNGGPVAASSASADDVLHGTSGDDRLAGGLGQDVISGRKGGDLLRGGQGDDELKGGLGRDQLRGGDGDDWIVGGRGGDRLAGHEGADSFVFAGKHFGTRTDRIKDYALGEDRIVFQDLAAEEVAQLTGQYHADKGGVILRATLETGAEHAIFFKGHDDADALLHMDNYAFLG